MTESSVMITMGAIRTVGVDLSAEPDRTAICAVNWTSGAASVEPPIRPADDAAVLAACASADRVGIDCPFGWPEPFLAAVSAHAAGQPWPGRHRTTDRDHRRELRYRATDYRIHEITGSWPLSVSTDRIGVAAMRCASLLDSLAAQGAPVDRCGSGRVVEVYPAAALHVWRLLRPGYKRDRNVLDTMVTELLARLPSLLFPLSDEPFRRSDHAFDALICALVARAVQRGVTAPPQTGDQLRRATFEGWIHLPDGGPESLTQLAAVG
jgi:predicted nuclease with RNAse H fold